jgi:large subunit ribosomal protein L31
MKKGIHPEFYPNAKVKCACGASFETGATIPEFNVEICSSCHPFFTGKQKFVDTAGKVDKFQKKFGEKREFGVKSSKRAPKPVQTTPVEEDKPQN